CCLTLRAPPRSPLFPYTTLFRSKEIGARGSAVDEGLIVEVDGRELVLLAPIVLGMLPFALVAAPGSIPRTIGARRTSSRPSTSRSEEHTSELQSLTNLVCRLLLA